MSETDKIITLESIEKKKINEIENINENDKSLNDYFILSKENKLYKSLLQNYFHPNELRLIEETHKETSFNVDTEFNFDEALSTIYMRNINIFNDGYNLEDLVYLSCDFHFHIVLYGTENIFEEVSIVNFSTTEFGYHTKKGIFKIRPTSNSIFKKEFSTILNGNCYAKMILNEIEVRFSEFFERELNMVAFTLDLPKSIPPKNITYSSLSLEYVEIKNIKTYYLRKFME